MHRRIPTPSEYLARIDVHALVSVDADGLRHLHRAHLLAVPFENLDIHRGFPIVLDEGALLDKIVRRHRGGFCYELNGTFAWLLGELGFEVERLAAQVHGEDGGWGIELDHMTLRVDLAEPWLVDVGFGDGFVEPLRWADGQVQSQTIGDFRLDRDGPHWILSRRNAGESAFVPQYRFTDEPLELKDFEPGCAYHQTPPSHFAKGPICSQATPGGRITRYAATASSKRRPRPAPRPPSPVPRSGRVSSRSDSGFNCRRAMVAAVKTHTLAASLIFALLGAACGSATPDPPAPDPSNGPLPVIALADLNPTSATFNTLVSSDDFLGHVSAWYFGHAT